MPSPLRRHALAGLLILVAAAAGVVVQVGDRPDPALPPEPALAGAAWRVETAYAPGYAGMPYRQWLLRDGAGAVAELYIGATGRLQPMLHWTGELGYQGEGYLVTDRRDGVVRLAGGSLAPVSEVRVRRLDDDRLLVYGVVGPDGLEPAGTSRPLQTAWAALLGRDGPHYLLRVSVPVAGNASARALETASAVVAAAAPPLLARARGQPS